MTKEALSRTRPKSLWRYREVLPVRNESDIVTLGEGWTPLLPAPRLAARHGLRALFIKEEGQNPTGSFKARGMATAVSMAKQFKLKKLVVPSAGNAAGAPWRRMPRGPKWRPSYSCRATPSAPTSWSASRWAPR